MRTAGCENHSMDVGQALVLESGQRSGLSAADSFPESSVVSVWEVYGVHRRLMPCAGGSGGDSGEETVVLC